MPPIRQHSRPRFRRAFNRSTCSGPVEVFDYAEREVPGSYAIDVVGPGDRRLRDDEQRRAARRRAAPGAAAAGTTRSSSPAARAPAAAIDDPAIDRLDRARVAARSAHHIGLHRLLPAGRCRPSRRPPRDDALGVLRRRWPLATRRCRLDPDPGLRPRRRRLDVGGRDGRHRPRAGARRGRPRARGCPGRRAHAGRVPQAARRAVTVHAARCRPSRHRGPALRELQAWIAGHLDEDLSVAALADRANLSERSFARAFQAEVGQTPAAYVEALRVERARALLEDGAESLEAVARAGGLHQHRGPAPRLPPPRRRQPRRLPRTLPPRRVMASVMLDELRFSYGTFEAVRGISLQVRRGELFALLGTNGAGKTSTLELLEGFGRRPPARCGCSATTRIRERAPRSAALWSDAPGVRVPRLDMTVPETVAMLAEGSRAARARPPSRRPGPAHPRAAVAAEQLSGGERRRLDAGARPARPARAALPRRADHRARSEYDTRSGS